MHAGVAECAAGLDDFEDALNQFRSKSGALRRLGGDDGIVPALDRSDYEALLSDAKRTRGDAIPENEVLIYEQFLADENVTLGRGVAVKDHLAEFLVVGDENNELALFGKTGRLPPSELLTVSGQLHT